MIFCAQQSSEEPCGEGMSLHPRALVPVVDRKSSHMSESVMPILASIIQAVVSERPISLPKFVSSLLSRPGGLQLSTRSVDGVDALEYCKANVDPILKVRGAPPIADRPLSTIFLVNVVLVTCVL